MFSYYHLVTKYSSSSLEIPFGVFSQNKTKDRCFRNKAFFFFTDLKSHYCLVFFQYDYFYSLLFWLHHTGWQLPLSVVIPSRIDTRRPSVLIKFSWIGRKKESDAGSDQTFSTQQLNYIQQSSDQDREQFRCQNDWKKDAIYHPTAMGLQWSAW